MLVPLWVCAGPLSGQSTDEEQLNALRALGYINHPPEPREGSSLAKSGLVFSRQRYVAPGYTLLTAIPEAQAVLVDNQGRYVQKWRDEHAQAWTRSLLLEDGDLLVIGDLRDSREQESLAARGDKSPAVDPLDGKPWWPIHGQYLARYSWDGDLKWRRAAIIHHDIGMSRNGKFLTLGLQNRTVDDVTIEDHTVLILSPTGEIESRYSLFDLLSSNPGMFKMPMTTSFPRPHSLGGELDLLHSNAISSMFFPGQEDPDGIYCEHCVIVTVRHQNLVAVFDLEQEKLLWVWGPGELEFPHEGRLLKNGNILIFDNGSEERGFSRIVEVEPSSGNIVWSYQADPPESFFTAGRGTSQPLPNGNVLIASSNQGQIFEVTRNGQLVWHYYLRGRGFKLLTMRAAKYPPSWVDPLLSSE